LEWPPLDRLAERFRDSAYSLAFARIVTHYTRNNLWLEDGVLLRDADALSGHPGVLINGRFDLQAPLSNAWELKRVWRRAELVVVDEAGHAAQQPGIASGIVRATDGFARTGR
jgi:proline iminopeptidase